MANLNKSLEATSWSKVLLGTLVLALAGCTNPIIKQEPEMYTVSGSIAPYSQSTFDAYVDDTFQWLDKTRVFHGAGYDAEMAAVSPYRLKPESPNGKGILLVHGLGDSPYSFIDIAPVLAEEGYLVHVMLLPGHGSRPADLMSPTLEDWRKSVANQIAILQNDVDTVWLGGFSTGTNLVTTYAANNPDAIEGLVLFSPAYSPDDFIVRFAGAASMFVDWVNIAKEQNYTRYDSLAMHGASLYYQTTKEVKETLESNQLTIPALLMVSENDELIDTESVYSLFRTEFVHPNSRLVWYGEKSYPDARVIQSSMKLPEQNIESGSHISVLYRADNPLYGERGLMRQCGGEVEGEVYTVDCVGMPTLTYTAWGLFEQDKVSARLSWNPYFDAMMSRVIKFMQNDGVVK
ncbi:alpha/beta hydrolase [Vibrio maritimus]|nr:alpha/beta fold hydrolase [Vibrio maritimus]